MRPGRAVSADRTPTRPPAPSRLVPLTPSPEVRRHRYGGLLRVTRSIGPRRDAFIYLCPSGLQVGPYYLTATARGPGDNRRCLYLLYKDFRDIRFRMPWTRKLWPRRGYGR